MFKLIAGTRSSANGAKAEIISNNKLSRLHFDRLNSE